MCGIIPGFYGIPVAPWSYFAADEVITYANLLPELFVLPNPDHSAWYVKQVMAIPQKSRIVLCMHIPDPLHSRGRDLVRG